MSGRRNRKLVFSRDVQAVNLVQQMGARTQDHNSRPFHQLTHFGKPGCTESACAQFIRHSGDALAPQELSSFKFARVDGLPDGFKRKWLHSRYLYIWLAVSCAANMFVKYVACCSMEAISASAAAIWFCSLS